MSEMQDTGNKKKIVLISVIAIVVVILIAGLMWYFVSKEKSE